MSQYRVAFSLVTLLSQAREAALASGAPRSSTAASLAKSTFERETLKYWVEPEKVSTLKLDVLKMLPIYIRARASSQSEPSSTAGHATNALSAAAATPQEASAAAAAATVPTRASARAHAASLITSVYLDSPSK